MESCGGYVTIFAEVIRFCHITVTFVIHYNPSVQNHLHCISGQTRFRLGDVLLTIHVVVVYFDRDGPQATIAFGVVGPLQIAETGRADGPRQSCVSYLTVTLTLAVSLRSDQLHEGDTKRN